MSEETLDLSASIKHKYFMLCVKYNGALYQVHSKSINITKTLNDDRLLAVADLDGEILVFKPEICMIEEQDKWNKEQYILIAGLIMIILYVILGDVKPA